MDAEIKITLTPPGKDTLEVSAIVGRPDDARALFVFGHGAGAGMRHVFMQDMAQRFHRLGVATLRYNFPHIEAGLRRPSPRPTLLATVAAALARARELADGLPIFAGGKSMGGRMTSTWLAGHSGHGVSGVVFLGFPLHPANRPSTSRADHLREVELPLCFVHGTRDKLGDLGDLRPVVSALGPRATLHVIEGADHGFAVRKKDGRSPEEVLSEVATRACEWIHAQVRGD